MKIPFLNREIPKRAALVVVALVAAAGVVTGREKPALERIETKASRAEISPVVEIDLEKLHRAESTLPQNDPFARRDFVSPKPALAAPQAAPAPSAPPLPFKYFGKVIDQGKLEVFVMRGDELISIAAGKNIDAEYRVERITDTSIRFTYLPLKAKQSLELPG